MPASREYAKRAEKCFRLAAEARSETDRVACLDLAQKWLEAASASPQDETTADHIAKAEKSESERKARTETTQPQSLPGWRERLRRLFRLGSMRISEWDPQ